MYYFFKYILIFMNLRNKNVDFFITEKTTLVTSETYPGNFLCTNKP